MPEQEALHLDFNEACFLVYGLGALDVFDDFVGVLDRSATARGSSLILSPQDASQTPIPPLRLWDIFRARGGGLNDPANIFVVKYVAYHYFRSLGWVVRPGIKFGTDFGRSEISVVQAIYVLNTFLSIG
jgi:tRNA-splicing endonuclease subunit Sen2